MQTPRDIAREYINRGWAPVPIAHREKAPKLKGWGTLKLSKEAIDGHFNGNGSPQNIGVILGDASGGLIDIDLDCPEAIALAPEFLPETGAIFGRKSKPRSHYLYYVQDLGDKAAIRHQDDANGTIVELRTGGGKKAAQTVFPGSTLASGSWVGARRGVPHWRKKQWSDSGSSVGSSVREPMDHCGPPDQASCAG